MSYLTSSDYKDLAKQLLDRVNVEQLNLKTALAEYVSDRWGSGAKAEEVSEDEGIRRKLAEAIDVEAKKSWFEEGVPSPLEAVPGQSYVLYVGLLHKTYTGGLHPDFYFWKTKIREANEYELNFYVAAYFTAAGASNVLVVDRSGDGGVDVLASWPKSGIFGGVSYAAQVKAFGGALNKGDIEALHDKIRTGLTKDVWLKYAEDAELRSSLGKGLNFAVMAQKGLSTTGIQAAQARNMWNLQPKKIAFELGKSFHRDCLFDIIQSLAGSPRDTSRNVARAIAGCLK